MTARTEVLCATVDQALDQALEAQDAVEAVARCVRREALVKAAASMRPHAAIVSTALPGDMPWEEVFARLRGAGVRVVLLAPGVEPGDAVLEAAVEAGVYDILPAPDPESVLRAVAHPATLRDARRWLGGAAAGDAHSAAGAGGEERRGDARHRYRRAKLLVPWSPKGGAGKTTVACELGYQAALAGRRVILIDLNLGNPEAGGRLGLSKPGPRQGMNVLLSEGVTPERLITASQKAHGMLVLAPPRPGVGDVGFLDLTLEEAERLLDAAVSVADLVIVDTATMMNDPATYAAIRRADEVLLITEQARTVVEIVQAQSGMVRRLGVSPRLVINKYDAQAGASIRDIEQFCGLGAAGVIPHDRAGYLRAMMDGVPYAAIANGQGRAWQALTAAFLGLPQHAPATKRSGWSFGRLFARRQPA